MAYEATGTIHFIGDTKQVSERFSKRAFVLTIGAETKYPQLVEFELGKDRCALLDGMNIGDTVRVEFDLRGREWTKSGGDTRYFVSLNAWKLTRTAEAKAAPQSAGGSDDLPF